MPDLTLTGHTSVTFPSLYRGFRGLHQVEGGRVVAYPGAPAVLPPIDTRALPMTEDIQWMSFQLMARFAPAIDEKKWRALHGHGVAMNNGAQNGYDGGEPHADFINGLDLADSLPRYDKMQRAFQGSFIRGETGYSLWQGLLDFFSLAARGNIRGSLSALTTDNLLICKPGLHGIDATKPLPSISEIVRNNWYMVAVTAGNRIFNFPHGDGSPVVYPFIFDREIRFPLSWFQKWERDYLPNPLLTYT